MLVTYETTCPQNRVPQTCVEIRNTLSGKNITPHYALLPPETGTFLHDFKQG
ncbi:MAG: hypothetical protein J6P38_04645 [Acetobacter sp.]|nr:hypothetical protein [Acetobacter sp.]